MPTTTAPAGTAFVTTAHAPTSASRPIRTPGNKVAFGAKVKLSNIDTEEESVYRLVGADEANLDQGSISITSPLARALIGREVGDEVKVRMPAGERIFEILEVEYR